MMPRLSLFCFVLAITAFLHAGETTAADAARTSQTSNQGGVTITVTPPKFSGEASSWDFAITLESHVQSLDDDLTSSAMLLGDGKSYPPLKWDGTSPGGHHRKGVLHFKPITPLPQSVELQIRRAGETNPRVFRWELRSFREE